MNPEQTNNPTQVIHVRDLRSRNHRIALLDPDLEMEWNSRSHRKRRNATIHDRIGLRHSATRNHWLLWAYQPQNLSWWVPFFFTLGSIVWLANGVIAVWPLPSPAIEAWASSFSALLGGFIFILGASAAYIEVINRPDYVHVHSDATPHAHPSHHHERHQHQPSRLNWLAWEHHNWAWWLNTLQLIGALVFFMACAAGMLLPIHYTFDENAWFWMPQMIGAVFFLASSVMALLEVQDRPWKPAWNKIGWHSALFNAIGAIGFFLCAYFGAIDCGPDAKFWGSNVSTLWGSAAFLISSYLMMLEAVNP